MNWLEFQRLLDTGNFAGKVSKDDLSTPCLVVDLDIFDRNLHKMAAHLKTAGKAFRKWRPAIPSICYLR